jgi:hypothetical protein
VFFAPGLSLKKPRSKEEIVDDENAEKAKKRREIEVFSHRGFAACMFVIFIVYRILWFLGPTPQPIERREPRTNPSKISPAWECVEK